MLGPFDVKIFGTTSAGGGAYLVGSVFSAFSSDGSSFTDLHSFYGDADGEDPKPRMNHAISVPFEPGSVYKVVTLSAALEIEETGDGEQYQFASVLSGDPAGEADVVD